MRKILVLSLFSMLLGAPAYGQDVHIMWKCGTTGFAAFCQVETANPLPVTVTGGSLTVTSDATATAAAPSYSEGIVNPLSQTLTGNLRTTGVGGSFPITAASGSVASGAVASGAYASGALASGSIASGAMVDLVANQTPVAAGAATATKGLLLGGQYDSTQKTLTNGQQAALSASPRGALFVATGADTFTVTGASGTFPITAASGAVASGAYASGSIASGALASGSIASGAMVDLVALSAPVAPATATATKSMLGGCQATTAAVNPTNSQQSACSNDTNNNLLVSAGGAPTIATSQASVTTGNVSIASARALRRAITITNVTGTGPAYCGNTGVTTSTGTYLAGTTGSSITLNTTAAVFCTVAATTQTVTAVETY